MRQMPEAQSARELAYQVLYKVAHEGSYANIAMKDALSGCILSVQDRAFATELVYGVCRMRMRLDHELSQLVKKGLGSLNPDLLIILRLGIYQLEFTAVKPFAAVNETVRLAYKYFNQGAAGLCNGVLRSYQREAATLSFPDKEKSPAAYLEAYYSYPRFMAGYFLKRWGMEASESFCSFGNRGERLCVYVNTIRSSADALAEELRLQGVEVTRGKYLPECLYLKGCGDISASPLFKAGKFAVLDEGSALCAKALAAPSGSRVLDMCAAPGGKTCVTAIEMQDKGEILACDLYEHRVALIEQNAARLRLHSVKTMAADSRALPEELHESFDHIMLDAPCSGWGVLGRKADARFNKKFEDIAELAQLSFELLEAAAGYLKPGGTILYSTCTVTAEENENNIARFLAAHPEFATESLDSLLPYAKTEEERAALASGMWQILPQKQGLEGFFLCRLKKKN